MSAVVARVVLQRPDFAGAEKVVNDVVVRERVCVFGRWTGRGALPPGINWVGMDEGLRFWGTPTRLGEWEAEFEGPYPANFQSELTLGGSDRPPLQLDAGEVPGEIVVSKFLLQFQVVEQVGYSFGQVLKELYSNTSASQTARRLSWTGTRCLGARGLSASAMESGVPAEVDLSVAEGLDSVAANLAALVNSSGVATAVAAGSQVTITALEVGSLQISGASTKSGSLSVQSVTQGSSTARQVSRVSLSGAFVGGVVYTLSLGGVAVSVRTVAKPKFGLWLYAGPDNALDAEGLTARGVRNDDLTGEDYAAGDWVFSETPVIDRGYAGCLSTLGVQGRSFLDGVKRSVAVSAVISI